MSSGGTANAPRSFWMAMPARMLASHFDHAASPARRVTFVPTVPGCPAPGPSGVPVQITRNTTGMLAAVTVTADKDARDYCVVVVKGTFVTSNSGAMELASEQTPFVYADEHYGDPESTSIRYESDFSLFKPLTDVVVVGKAVAPGGRPTEELAVSLEVQGSRKDVIVIGERRWVRAAGGVVASRPVPFAEVPLTFDRAFGAWTTPVNRVKAWPSPATSWGWACARSTAPRSPTSKTPATASGAHAIDQRRWGSAS
jgi:hypothetical protein